MPRMERITESLFSSKYSIHDLSRCSGEAERNLARFNMPLELGIAIALRYIEIDVQLRHDWLLLVPEEHSYYRFVSYLACFDALKYDLKPESVIPIVMSWLATRPEAISTPTPGVILSKLDEFENRRLRQHNEWRGQLPWRSLLQVAREVSEEIPIT